MSLTQKKQNDGTNKFCTSSLSKYYYIVIIISEIIMLVSCLTGAKSSGMHKIYFVLHSSLLLLTGIMLTLDQFWKKKSGHTNRTHSTATFLHLFLLAMWSAGVSVAELTFNTHLIMFTYVLFLLSVLPVMTQRQSIFLFIFSGVFINGLAHIFFPASPFLLRVALHSTSVCVCALIISLLLYKTRIQYYAHKQSMEQEYAQIKKINEQLSRDIMTDKLTGLYNRRYMDEVFSISAYEKLFCIMVDIDYFKRFNDTYGHQMGDDCLIAVARILKDFCKNIDAEAVRYGGEEFVVFRWNTDLETVVREGECVRKMIENFNFTGNDKCLPITVSMGIAEKKASENADGCTSKSQMIKCSDIALYTAKRDGRNRVQVYIKP